VRAFETFARMLGQPGRDEADPSPLLALIAPLLFGFMFGDVGQGAVLCAAGWLLRKRLPTLALLVPGGLMAIVFGFLFGSVFAREDVIPALWLHPLHEPVVLLAVALGLGALILLGGLALNAAQAFWRRAGERWWARDAGFVLAYAGLLAAPIRHDALWLVPAGALWMAAGSASIAERGRAAAFARALAEFVEQALQIVVNTVSFTRVGAFALAHAGLSAAVTGVAQASGAVGYWIVLLLGNALILLLEGLVVGIQTTRLLLFEFFVRFLRGSGRAFRPLPPPLALLEPKPNPGSPP
jgi:V/A-type H+-transporting ATPase subunit I